MSIELIDSRLRHLFRKKKMSSSIMISLVALTTISLPASAYESTVTLRKCVNFQASYAGSWLASSELFQKTKWKDRAALEFATRDMYNTAHSLRGSGWKTNDPVTDFMVVHLSGIEHNLVRSLGFEKGIAQTNRTSHRVLQDVLSRPNPSPLEQPQNNPRHQHSSRKLKKSSKSSKHAPAPTKEKGRRHGEEEEEEGGFSSSHLLKSTEGGHDRVGVSKTDFKADGGFASELARRTVAVVPFYGGAAKVTKSRGKSGLEKMNATLPAGAGNSHTLAPTDLKCLQVCTVVASVLSSSVAKVVVVGVVSNEEAKLVARALKTHLPAHFLTSERVQVVVIPCGAMSVYLPYRLLNWVKAQHKAGGLFLPGGGENVATTVSSTSVAATASSSTEPGVDRRFAFDFVYYTEADNVLYLKPGEGNFEAVAAALVTFLDSADGAKSYILPQRLENSHKRGDLFARTSSADSASAPLDLKGLHTVGQNNCQDARGDTAAFASPSTLLGEEGGGGLKGGVRRTDTPGVTDKRKARRRYRRHRH